MKELRTRVVAAVEQGEHSIPEIARLFGVGTTFVKKMLRLHASIEPDRIWNLATVVAPKLP